jgi:TonB family protein
MSIYDSPEIAAEERKNERISALLTAATIAIFLLISFIWTGFRLVMPPPGEEEYEVVGAIDFGDYNMGSRDINNLEPAIEDPAPEPVEEVAAPDPQPEVTETREDPTPVVTQEKPSPVTQPDVPPKVDDKPKEKETVVEDKPKEKPTETNTGQSQNNTPKETEQPKEDTKPTGSNQGEGGDVGNAGLPNDKVFDDRYAFQWGSSSGGGGGARRILAAPYPEYNSQEEGILEFTITIRPDGTVSRVIPAPTLKRSLKNAAMAAIRRWRFSPLPSDVSQQEQTVKMAITFRLKG